MTLLFFFEEKRLSILVIHFCSLYFFFSFFLFSFFFPPLYPRDKNHVVTDWCETVKPKTNKSQLNRGSQV